MSGDETYRDALADGPVRGRGAGIDPGNRFDGIRLHVLGEHLDARRREHPDGSQVRTEFIDDNTRTIINRVDSPDQPFDWTINPYRGCEHGCIYCYARPTHETLGFTCGIDFETKIMVKREAPALLRRELASPKWRGEPITMSGVTDPYQPIERTLRVTRGCLDVFAECRQPVCIVTKNRLIARDMDLLRELARYNAVRVAVSVTTLDAHLASVMEPRTSSPRDRLRAINELTDAGVPTMAMVAPVIPGLNDREIPAILKAVCEAGAIKAAKVLLRLPHQLKPLFLEWLHRHVPDRAQRVEQRIRDTRRGKLYDATFGERKRGAGLYAEQIQQTFRVFAKRYGLDQDLPAMSSAHFRRPNLDGQFSLFE